MVLLEHIELVILLSKSFSATILSSASVSVLLEFLCFSIYKLICLLYRLAFVSAPLAFYCRVTLDMWPVFGAVVKKRYARGNNNGNITAVTAPSAYV